MNIPPKQVTLVMTGASGVQYGLGLLKALVEANINVYLLLSRPARIVINSETDIKIPSRASEIQQFFNELYKAKEGQIQVFEKEQWMAPVASGTGVADAMVICPCTTGTLAAASAGLCRTLIERSIDVTLKERKKLIVVLRETPLSDIHLENMLKLSKMGAIMMPANPAYYQMPKTLQDIENFMVGRILDHLNVRHKFYEPWGE